MSILLKRFEELEAGRIIGNLDSKEAIEWRSLSQELEQGPDLDLELVAAAVEVSYLTTKPKNIPARLAESIRVDTSAGSGSVITPKQWTPVKTVATIGWAIAACLAILVVLQSFPADSPPATPEVAAQSLRSEANDLVELNFSGLGDYDKVSGSVLWSDQKQEGYMLLSNLPVNNPSKNQYQLWIVDPARDEKPVDGGVFDISAESGTVVVPIRNPLAVRDPQAFVITLEQPGGVVVSKQEVVVALAKPS